MNRAVPVPRPTWKALLGKDRPLVLPGAYDALSARLIEKCGFEAYVIGGFPLVGARYALPDIGLVGLAEMAEGVRDIVSAARLPVLVDGDHGYGDVKNVTRTVRTYAAMGASALLLEDQVLPKRCGHWAGKSLIATEAMERKLRAAVAAREGADLFIIARTDARAVLGLDEALRRAERYIAAGADGLFVEAPESPEELDVIARRFDVPQMCNMLVGGVTPMLTNRELHDMGFAMIVHGTTLIKRIARALEEVLIELKEDRLDSAPEKIVGLDEFTRMVDLDQWRAIEEAFE